MEKIETLSNEAQFADTPLYFNSFAYENLGMLKTQTVLKVDSYALICVPYQFSMKRGILAGAFSKEEIEYFQKYRNSLAGLALAFQKPDAAEPMKIFCRCQITGIAPMKGREGVGLIVCDWKPIPPDLADLLAGHFRLLEQLKLEYRDLADKTVPITPVSAKRLGFNNYAILKTSTTQQKLAVFSLAANRMDFLLSPQSPDFHAGDKLSITLFFQRYRFALPGMIDKVERLPTGVQRCRASLGFSPELMQLLEEYFKAKG